MRRARHLELRERNIKRKDENMNSQPNILWFITDQQSASMLGCAGNPYVRTPNMDYLAAHGVRFENAYCANPACVPSRFALMTGMYPSTAGVTCNAYDPEPPDIVARVLEKPFGTMLRERGYETVFGGVDHAAYVDCRDLGFDYICGDERDVLARECARYITDSDKSKPFVMVASFINPHDICLMAINDFAHLADNESDKKITAQMPVPLETMRRAAMPPENMNPKVFFECLCPPLPENYEPAPDEPEAVAMLQRQRGFKQLARERYTDEQWRVHRWAYARLTEMVDAQIGVVLDALIRSGAWDDTVIVLTSDHGDMDASHRMEHKEALYQECCKVPFIVKGLSGKARNITDGRLVSGGLDCLPTILEYAGIKKPATMRGISHKNIVEGGDPSEERTHLVVESEFGQMAVSRTHKYVRYFHGARNEQFYDLVTNGGEMFNQIGDARYKDSLEFLRSALDRHANRS